MYHDDNDKCKPQKAKKNKKKTDVRQQNDSGSYQFEPWQWDGREVNGAALSDVDKASFQHSDGTQYMNPPAWKVNMKCILNKQYIVQIVMFLEMSEPVFSNMGYTTKHCV